MNENGARWKPQLRPRIAGMAYLINIATGIFAIMVVRAALFVEGNAGGRLPQPPTQS